MKLLATLSAAAIASAASSWRHGWDTASAMTFADFNPPSTLSDAQVEFVASKYRIVSLEKCTGIGSGVTTEESIYSHAQRIKAISPSTKVIFYLSTDQAGIGCYSAGAEFKANPDWWLRDDNGNVVNGKDRAIMDYTNPKARAWWLGIPLGGINGTGMYNGVPVTTLIDGILADGAGWAFHKNMSLARIREQTEAKRNMVAELQNTFTKANGGVVMANGINNYDPPNADPDDPYNLGVLNFTNAVMNEHTAVFESVNRANDSFKMDMVARNLNAIEAAAKMDNGSKTVFVQTWPGLYTTTGFNDGTIYPPGGEPSPVNNSMWRDALRSHFAFAQALFLTIAAENVYWFYGGYWYSSNTGIVACPQDPTSCPSPPEWYPDLEKPLGEPLGERVEVSPYVWTRDFKYATVRLDLFNRSASKVTYRT